jgi:transmembrane protein 231
MVQLFSQPILKIYRAPIASCSFLFCLLLLIICTILPFFLAFSTYDFWKVREWYIEQPQVLYRKELLIAVYSEQSSVSGSSIVKSPSVQFFSTLGAVNQLYFSSFSPMTISSSLLDYNFDGLADMYDFNFTVFSAPANIRAIKILSFYDYRIRNRVKMDLVGMAYCEINTPTGAGYVYIDGDLRFQQKSLMTATSSVNNDYNFSVLSTAAAAENMLPLMLLRYNDRNYTTEFEFQSVVVDRGLDESCGISMKVRVPANEKFEYAPGFLEVMKFAWIQYLSLALPVGYAVYRMAAFVFRNQVLEAQVSYESKVVMK